ncbi:ERG4/ERG24 ergosterol biosynthesis protein [Thelephora ganbajun]|uniref:ERG4/ERG24 ergosterol biosynthesis protein n=1 Tax=Thelephora ganbajun TaxID=370292 RepID=A0ACB6ZWV2_THEGA|nr:ERG4/ERG24 ergosterol biosynthesis protein [Thelephora ganbajun]
MVSSTAVEKKSELNPRTTAYEFAGPVGAALIIVTIPLTTYLLYFGCSQRNGCPPSLASIKNPEILDTLQRLEFWKGLWDTEAALMYLAWYAFCVVAWLVLPGDWIEGTLMRNGKKMKYKINAFSTFLLTMGVTAGVILRFGPESFTFIYDKWIGFVTASFVMSVVQSIYCYTSSFFGDKLLALGGNSGNFIYDFYIGRELNPTIGSFDLKSFNELRPGLILWALVDISMACEQYVRRGGTLTDSMILVLGFHLWYVADAVYNEPAIFTIMDITTDGFGYMLAVGDLLWVPFTYSLQARYLAYEHVELGGVGTAVVVLVTFTGYWIFRSANGEKNDFRNGRNPKNLTYMNTKRGTKLLTSGWWGRSRHPNYFGDWLMALSWSLATGFNTPITYFYPVYFFVLLVHRQLRDDEMCEVKYGDDWKMYKKLVPYRIIPYVY